MLAWLQRALVLLCLAAAGLAAWGLGALGVAWPWRVLAALVLALPHAPVLALECALLWRWGHDDSAPAPTLRQLARAWAGECGAGLQVFGWRQPWREHAQADVPGRPGQVGVLLVHGFVCNRGLWAPWLKRLRADGVPCTAISLAPVFGSIDGYAGQIDEAVAALARSTGRAPLVVAHSMGGLAVRAWLAAPGGAANAARVAHVVTVATPHHGTWLARFALSANARQMRIGSGWLQGLAAREPAGLYAHFTCFYGHADNVVFPPGQATLPGAHNLHLAGTAHVQMLFHPEVMATVLHLRRALQLQPPPGQAAT